MAARIAVVIPCFNYGRFLDEAVNSVLAQSCQDFEIVIVDDGSTEPETRSILDTYQRTKTKVLRTANRGPAAARNTGIQASDSRYIVSLDADDRLHPRFLEKTAAVLDADAEERLGFVTTWQQRFGDDNGSSRSGDNSLFDLAMANDIHGSALFRRRVWKAVGGYRESFTGWEDWNLWLNMVGAGLQWEVVPEALFYYRKHGESRSSNSFRNRQRLFEQVLEDNADFYRERHQEILKSCFRRLGELDGVWREKDLALSENRTLARQLRDEQESHRRALKQHRELEDYCRSLLSSLRDAQDGQSSAEQEYLRLEAYCLSLESALAACESDDS